MYRKPYTRIQLFRYDSVFGGFRWTKKKTVNRLTHIHPTVIPIHGSNFMHFFPRKRRDNGFANRAEGVMI